MKSGDTMTAMASTQTARGPRILTLAPNEEPPEIGRDHYEAARASLTKREHEPLVRHLAPDKCQPILR